MKLVNLSVIILLLNFNYLISQNNESCACCTEDHKAFDFWIGDWTVYNSEGDIIGANKIVKKQDGCVLQENWTSSNQTNTGTSYNFFDSTDNIWNQVWISNTGNVLKLKGNLNSKGEMVLKSELVEDSKGDYYNQITWSKNKDSSVTQKWIIIDENGDILRDVFSGIYRRSD